MQKKAPTLSAAADTSGRGALRASLTVALAAVGTLLVAQPALGQVADNSRGVSDLRYTAAQMRAATKEQFAQRKAAFVADRGLPSISDSLYERMLDMDATRRSACMVMLKNGRPENHPACK